MAKINKAVVETVKTVTIAVLITGIVAFVGGMKYHATETAQVQAAVKAATSKE